MYPMKWQYSLKEEGVLEMLVVASKSMHTLYNTK